MTRADYNMLSQILDHLEEELAILKAQKAVEVPSADQTVKPVVTIKVNMNISTQ